MANLPITHIVHHYSATYPDQDIGAKEIDGWHRARGFTKIGYHYVIRRDGTIEAGRPEREVGAHVGRQNTGKIGICCIGGLERDTGGTVGVDNRTPAQIASAIRLTRDLLQRYPGAQVVGHKDLSATQCPGFDVASWWADVNRPRATATVTDPADERVRAEGASAGVASGLAGLLAAVAAAAAFYFMRG